MFRKRKREDHQEDNKIFVREDRDCLFVER